MSQRILLVVRKLQIGGIERVTINLANALNRLGHEVHILVLKGGDALTPDAGVHVHHCDFDKSFRRTGIGLAYDLATRALLKPLISGSGFVWRGAYGGWYLKRFVAKLEREHGPVDRIIIRGQGAYEMVWSWRDPRLWLCIESWPGRIETGPRKKFLLKCLYHRKNIICNSQGVETQFKKILNHHKITTTGLITTIYTPCDIDAVRRLAEEPVALPFPSYIVHVARLSKVKRQDLLIRAYHQADIEEHLIIIGDGPLKEHLQNVINDLKLNDKVHLLGSCKNPYPWMKHAKLTVLSSSSEGLGMVLVESLACGTPATAINAPGGIADVLIEDQARLLAEDSIKGLASKINEGIEIPPELKEDWLERFRDATIAKKFLALP